MVKQLVKEFKNNFDCFVEEYTNKYITFSVVFYRKNIGNKVIIYKLKSIDSFRFMSVNLSEIKRNIPLNKLIEKFTNTHQFCNKNINKFALLLKKVRILVNIQIPKKNLMKHHYQTKNFFVVD